MAGVAFGDFMCPFLAFLFAEFTTGSTFLPLGHMHRDSDCTVLSCLHFTLLNRTRGTRVEQQASVNRRGHESQRGTTRCTRRSGEAAVVVGERSVR